VVNRQPGKDGASVCFQTTIMVENWYSRRHHTSCLLKTTRGMVNLGSHGCLVRHFFKTTPLVVNTACSYAQIYDLFKTAYSVAYSHKNRRKWEVMSKPPPGW
jgi:hypothetical protein